MQQFTIREYDDFFERVWRDMFVTYFVDDIKGGLTAEVVENRICNSILASYRSRLLSICIAGLNDKPMGFAIYQIDTPEIDWCKREGWGFIREFYIDGSCRGYGYGNRLCRYVEEQLYKRGVVVL